MGLALVHFVQGIDIKPGEKIVVDLQNITNVTYPCLLIDNQTYFTASIAPGEYTCNITGMGIEQTIQLSTGGGGISSGKYVSKKVIQPKNTSFNLGSVESKKPYWSNIKKEVKPIEPPKQEPEKLQFTENTENKTITKEPIKDKFNWLPLIILGGVILVILAFVIIGYATQNQ